MSEASRVCFKEEYSRRLITHLYRDRPKPFEDYLKREGFDLSKRIYMNTTFPNGPIKELFQGRRAA